MIKKLGLRPSNLITDQDQYWSEIYIFNDEEISDCIDLIRTENENKIQLSRRMTNLCEHAPNFVDAFWECAKVAEQIDDKPAQEGFLRCMMEMNWHGHAKVREGYHETVKSLCEQAERFVIFWKKIKN